MQRVERLVAELYSPTAPPEAVQVAQRGIQELQKSGDGWMLGHALLGAADPKAQFLGAQTLLVKLNDGKHLPSWPQVQASLESVIDDVSLQRFAPFVSRKLLAVVVKAYMISSEWTNLPSLAVQKLGRVPQYASDFLTFLVEDSELDASAARLKLVPEASNVARAYFEAADIQSEYVLHSITVWSLAFFDVFKGLVGTLIANLQRSNSPDIYAVLRELYVVHWKNWLPQHRRTLTETLTTIVSSRYSSIPPPNFADDEEFVAYMQLVIAICLEDFEQNTELHPLIAGVATAPIPVVDDPLSSETLDFWNQYTENVISGGMTSHSNDVIAQVISGYWPRICLYPGLRSSDWEEFVSFRKDFADFLELSYPLLGLRLFDHLTNVVLSGLDQPEIDWLNIESALFCLNGLADIIGEDYRGDKPEFRSVQRIFQSQLWQALPQCSNLRVRQTAVNVIGCFVDFFLSPEGAPHLAVTLTYLFTSLSTPMLQSTASRSIQKLCDTCRAQLVGEVLAFLSVYAELKQHSDLGLTPHTRTVSGIACVIQAMPDSLAKADALDSLIAMAMTPLVTQDSPELLRNRLKCVAAIGKNFQAPEPKQFQNSGFWTSGDSGGLAAHMRLQTIIAAQIRTEDLEDVEVLCDILKAGMTEDEGPFVFSQGEVIDFVKTKFELGPATVLGPVIDMSRFFISTQLASAKRRHTPGIPVEVAAGFIAVARQGGLDSASQSLDLLTQLLFALVYANEDFLRVSGGPEVVTEIALPGMASTDRFVLRSAASFWSTYAAQMPFHDEKLGMQLIGTLLLQISGQASRSDLLSITDVLKTLLQRQHFKTMNWLRVQVVDTPELRNIAKQDSKTRNEFLAQLALVKGNRKTVEIVQRFWLKCRGIPESYKPV